MLSIKIFVEQGWEELENLCWTKKIEQWQNVRFLNRRKGESRHKLFFIRTGKGDVVVKRTSEELAEREFYSYKKIISMGIPTIFPIGFIKKEMDNEKEGYFLSLYEKSALPESHLIRMLKNKTYRDLIWSAVVALLVVIHLKGIFWGDPSLDNILIKFYKKRVEALLIDAETVSFYESLSKEKEMEDLKRLFESLFAYSYADEEFDEKFFEKRKNYIENRYNKLKQILSETIQLGATNHFKLVKRIDNLFTLGYTFNPERFSPTLQVRFYPIAPRKGWFVTFVEEMVGEEFTPEQSRKIFREILMHQYEMSSMENRVVKLKEAAKDWYKNYFAKAKNIFKAYFPDKSPVKIYLEILDHKWYLSEQAGKDVGIVEAARSYSKKFGKKEYSSVWTNIFTLLSAAFSKKTKDE